MLYFCNNFKSDSMASNIFGRYVWLIDTLRRHKKLTYEQINYLWTQSGLSYGDGDQLPPRTFHNHRKAIKDIFDVYIECTTKGGYYYYIDNPEQLENDQLRCWLIDSYATLNQVHADEKLDKRIQFEDIPSGHHFLSTIIEAMRYNRVLEITHQGFAMDYESSFEIEPYFVKVVNRRWYVIARSPYKNKVLTYGLDRIQRLQIMDKTFELPEDSTLENYFEGCCGVINDDTIPIQKVVVKTYGYARKYIATLPIHKSQKEIATDDESTTFEYQIRPTYDFLQAILVQADQIEVVEPEWVRKQIKELAEGILSHYK